MARPSLKFGVAPQFQAVAERAIWSSLDLLLPPRCVNCRRLGDRFCARCRAETEYISDPVCEHCGYPQFTPTTDACDQCRRVLFSGQGIRSAAFHSGPIRQAIHSLKYRRNPPLSEALAKLMSRRWPTVFPNDAVFVPVPLSAERLRERGFNQAELLARHLGMQRRRPVLSDALQRLRVTRSQVGLSAHERRANVSGAFAAEMAKVRSLSVVLIDDVCTTGATLSACADALLAGGAKEVWAYTLARARRYGAD